VNPIVRHLDDRSAATAELDLAGIRAVDGADDIARHAVDDLQGRRGADVCV